MNNCLYCNKETSNKKYCSLHCSGKGIGFQIGNITWNTGLTKETDYRLKHVSERVKLAQTGVKESMETKETLSKMRVGHPYYGGFKGCLPGCKCNKHKVSKDTRKLIKNNSLNQWKNYSEEERNYHIQKILLGNSLKPNLLEIKFDKFLQENFPNEWKYVGDGQFILSGKCPDFININGKKIIIELFGNYWHKSEDPKIRKDIFGRYGYKTLIIWENEFYKNPDNIKEKIKII